VKPAPILLAAVAATFACNGSIRFDDRPGDAGDPSCPNGSCGWENDDCDGAVCHLVCRPATTCVGNCGASCAAECDSSSHCALTTGPNAHVHCGDGANCTFVLGDRSRAECSTGSTCRVRCSGNCELDCDAATCQIQCGSGPSIAVSRPASCP
jgi:hypothetical protein